jgi:hypothetical protein
MLPVFWFRIWFAEGFEEWLHAVFKPFKREFQGSGRTEYFAAFPTLLIAPLLMLGMWFFQKRILTGAAVVFVIWLLADKY